MRKLAVMAYRSGQAETIRLAATYVDRIPKGAKPADLPVEQPARADKVIE